MDEPLERFGHWHDQAIVDLGRSGTVAAPPQNPTDHEPGQDSRKIEVAY